MDFYDCNNDRSCTVQVALHSLNVATYSYKQNNMQMILSQVYVQWISTTADH